MEKERIKIRRKCKYCGARLPLPAEGKIPPRVDCTECGKMNKTRVRKRPKQDEPAPSPREPQRKETSAGSRERKPPPSRNRPKPPKKETRSKPSDDSLDLPEPESQYDKGDYLLAGPIYWWNMAVRHLEPFYIKQVRRHKVDIDREIAEHVPNSENYKTGKPPFESKLQVRATPINDLVVFQPSSKQSRSKQSIVALLGMLLLIAVVLVPTWLALDLSSGNLFWIPVSIMSLTTVAWIAAFFVLLDLVFTKTIWILERKKVRVYQTIGKKHYLTHAYNIRDYADMTQMSDDTIRLTVSTDDGPKYLFVAEGNTKAEADWLFKVFFKRLMINHDHDPKRPPAKRYTRLEED